MATEIERKIIELAAVAGKHFLSEETGFIHYNPHKEEGEPSQTIPVFENLLFALALLRTRKAEAIIQAKQLLERLLSYQSKTHDQGIGNFPIYLHEFPFCYSRWKAADLIVPLYLSLKNFQLYLGASLREKLSDCLKQLIGYLMRALEDEPADYLTTLKIGAGAKALGSYFGDADLERKGACLVDDLQQMGEAPAWFSRHGIAGVLTSLQLVYDKISESPWQKFWGHLQSTWHGALRNYTGPAFDEWQRGAYSDLSLYDFFLASFTNALPEKVVESDISCLLAAQVRFGGDQIVGGAEKSLGGMIGETKWAVFSGSHFGCSLISQGRRPDPVFAKGLRPFSLQWMMGKTLCNLSFEAGNYEAFSYEAKEDEFILSFKLPEQNGEQPMETQDLLFYFSPIDKAKITVDGHFSTTFKLGERVVIETSPKVSLTFELKEGKGDFLGHLMPGNRPSQRLVSKKGATDAFDWRIFLRAIRKHAACTVQVKVTLHA